MKRRRRLCQYTAKCKTSSRAYKNLRFCQMGPEGVLRNVACIFSQGWSLQPFNRSTALPYPPTKGYVSGVYGSGAAKRPCHHKSSDGQRALIDRPANGRICAIRACSATDAIRYAELQVLGATAAVKHPQWQRVRIPSCQGKTMHATTNFSPIHRGW